MKKISIVLVALLAILFSSNVYKAYSFKTSYANYRFYERFVEGRNRLTISITNIRVNHTHEGADNLYWDLYRRYSKNVTLKPYWETIQRQISCHALGEFAGHYKNEWNIEVQRNLSGNLFEWRNTKCNPEKWIDNKYLSVSDVTKFPPNQCIGNSCMYSISEKLEAK